MKLTTILEYQRCFNILRDAEMDNRRLRKDEYMDCVRIHSLFDYELAEEIKNQQLEVTNETRDPN